MSMVKVWDPVVRLFHWSLVVAFTLNATVIDDGTALHNQIGYTVLALVAIRVLWGFIGTRHARFSDFPPNPCAAASQIQSMLLDRPARHVGHSPLGAFMIYNLLLTLVLMGVSGWILTLPEATLGHDPEWAEELHEALFGWAVLSAVVHVAAVVFESRRSGVNLVRAMFTGRKALDDE